MSTTDIMGQGSGHIMVNSSTAEVICTAQVLDCVGRVNRAFLPLISG